MTRLCCALFKYENKREMGWYNWLKTLHFTRMRWRVEKGDVLGWTTSYNKFSGGWFLIKTGNNLYFIIVTKWFDFHYALYVVYQFVLSGQLQLISFSHKDIMLIYIDSFNRLEINSSLAGTLLSRRYQQPSLCQL